MISFFSTWVKNLCLALIIISILEMILPNNKTKKYIKMVMGLYVLFSIISPFIKNKDIFNNFNIETYVNGNEQSIKSEDVNQESMDQRLNEIYTEELEKDITSKLEQKNYTVEECNIKAYVSEKENDNGITEIRLIVKNKSDDNEEKNNETLENKIVTEVQKIQKIKIKTKEKTDQDKNLEKLGINDVQNIKKFLIDEYGVNEKCLKINWKILLMEIKKIAAKGK